MNAPLARPRTVRAASLGALAVLVAAAAPHFAAQEPGTTGQDPAPSATAAPLTQNERTRLELEQGLLGMWRLTRFHHPDRAPGDGEVVGAALFAPDAMSIVVHARREGPFEAEPLFFVQAGLHYWRVDEVLRLQTSSILAHSDLPGPMVYENAYQPREFDLRLDDHMLILTRPDTARLEFTRISETEFPEAALERIREARAARPGQLPR